MSNLGDARAEYEEILKQFEYGKGMMWQEVFVLLWILGCFFLLLIVLVLLLV